MPAPPPVVDVTSRPVEAGLVVPRFGARAILLGLAGVVAMRLLLLGLWADGLAVGAAFGLGLVALWVVAASPDLASGGWLVAARGPGAARRMGTAVVPGTGFGLALVGLAAIGASIGGFPIIPGLSRPDMGFLPWAGLTIAVASAEEGILRGVLFDRLRGAGGIPLAIVVTTIAFALIHVPVYGWHVVPLDLAVGLGLAGLRLSTGTVLAPAVAHAVADLATWWL